MGTLLLEVTGDKYIYRVTRSNDGKYRITEESRESGKKRTYKITRALWDTLKDRPENQQLTAIRTLYHHMRIKKKANRERLGDKTPPTGIGGKEKVEN